MICVKQPAAKIAADRDAVAAFDAHWVLPSDLSGSKKSFQNTVGFNISTSSLCKPML